MAGCGVASIPEQCAGMYEFTWTNVHYEVTANAVINSSGDIIGFANDAASGELLSISGTVRSNGTIDGSIEYTQLGLRFRIQGIFDANSCSASGTAEGGVWVANKMF
jgi:hypothetical protein